MIPPQSILPQLTWAKVFCSLAIVCSGFFSGAVAAGAVNYLPSSGPRGIQLAVSALERPGWTGEGSCVVSSRELFDTDEESHEVDIERGVVLLPLIRCGTKEVRRPIFGRRLARSNAYSRGPPRSI